MEVIILMEFEHIEARRHLVRQLYVCMVSNVDGKGINPGTVAIILM